MQLEQERHSSLAKDSQLSLLRQNIRSLIALGGEKGEGRGQDGDGMGDQCCFYCAGDSVPPPKDLTVTARVLRKGNRKRPLPVSGWEELIDEAAADLEQVRDSLHKVRSMSLMPLWFELTPLSSHITSSSARVPGA